MVLAFYTIIDAIESKFLKIIGPCVLNTSLRNISIVLSVSIQIVGTFTLVALYTEVYELSLFSCQSINQSKVNLVVSMLTYST